MNILQVNRNELKYEMHPMEALSLQSELDLLLQRDAYSAAGSYMVRSLYFDSLNDIDFLEKYAGDEKRKKLRIRIYHPDASGGKFEIKQKNGNYSTKKSMSVSRDEIEQAARGDFSFLLRYDTEIAMELYSVLSLGCYRAKTIIEYQRTAFQYPENHTRITFDQQIKCSETDLDLFRHEIPYHPVIHEKVILEVKYDDVLVKCIRDILRKYKLTQISVSKYAFGRPIYLQCML
ncbi:MAG: polyphosphate polymerase domain-containing protein [Eubacterium sp.]|nr:polyphosphate polymerase domain-containing protein [Eubacterium sp.]